MTGQHQAASPGRHAGAPGLSRPDDSAPNYGRHSAAGLRDQAADRAVILLVGTRLAHLAIVRARSAEQLGELRTDAGRLELLWYLAALDDRIRRYRRTLAAMLTRRLLNG